MNIGLVGWLVVFNVISTLVGYLMPIPAYIYIYIYIYIYREREREREKRDNLLVNNSQATFFKRARARLLAHS